MKSKPIIGIIGRIFRVNDKDIIQVDDDYRLAIIKSGGIPIIIVPPDSSRYDDSPISNEKKITEYEKQEIINILNICDGILMTGGTRWYEFDEIVCEYAVNNDIPILGICLGMQILANMDSFCNAIVRDETIKNETEIDHCQEDKKYVHSIRIIPGKLRNILKKESILVNSRHNYHVTYKNYFNVSAYSEDNLIEAIEIPNCSFAIGVQWHPESMIFYESLMLEIFKDFIRAGINHSKKN